MPDVGRPRIYERKESIRFTAEQLEVIDEIVDVWGVTFSEAIRMLVDAGIERVGAKFYAGSSAR